MPKNHSAKSSGARTATSTIGRSVASRRRPQIVKARKLPRAPNGGKNFTTPKGLLGSKPRLARRATASEILKELGVSVAQKRSANAAIKKLVSSGKIKLLG
jgi:hypothetical protein